MATLRRRYKGKTKPKTCTILIPVSGGMAPCGDKRFRAGRCIEHYTDWRNAREARGHEPLTVQPWIKPSEHPKETVRERRTRQGVSLATQNFLMDRAASKRPRPRKERSVA